MSHVAGLNAACIIAFAIMCSLAAFTYQQWLRAAVRAHFGEESRRDEEPRRRRRSFEWRCAAAVVSSYLAVASAWLRVSVIELLPAANLYFVTVIVMATIVAVAFVFAARARWNNPFEK